MKFLSSYLVEENVIRFENSSMVPGCYIFFKTAMREFIRKIPKTAAKIFHSIDKDGGVPWIIFSNILMELHQSIYSIVKISQFSHLLLYQQKFPYIRIIFAVIHI
jgi:hypothetical protein